MEAARYCDAALMETPFDSDEDVIMPLYEDTLEPSTLRANAIDNDGENEDGSRTRSASESMNSPCSENGIRVNMEISPTRWIKAKTKKDKPKQAKKKASAATRRTATQDGEHEQAEDDAVARRKQASIDQRRKRNREAMQRARQRDKDYMDGLRDTAHALEEKHNELLEKVNAQLAVFTNSGHSNSRIAELQDRLQQARNHAEALKRQNLEFLDKIGDRIKREDRMEGLLRELMREQEAQEEMLNEIFRESITETQLGVFFTEERAMRVIINSRNDKSQVERQGFDNAPVGDLFGWSTQYRFEGKIFYFSFVKTFRNRRAVDVMERNWKNAMNMVSYRNSVEAASQRWHTIQKINDETYLIARENRDPEKADEFVRLLYLRFRLHEDDGSYAVVTQSVRQEQSLYEGLDCIWANEACMWTQFTPMVERYGDEIFEACQVKMIGKSTIGDERSARENVLETILGLMRWENINVGPMLSLTNSTTQC